MNFGLAPEYLSSLVPDNVGQLVDYNLRNSNNAKTLHCNTQLYANSFLPSTIQDWNNLPIEVKNSPSLCVFKKHLNLNVVKPPTFLLLYH